MRRGAGWRFGALGARRFGLRLGDGLCGLGRGARCGGGRVGVGLLGGGRDGECGREGKGRTWKETGGRTRYPDLLDQPFCLESA